MLCPCLSHPPPRRLLSRMSNKAGLTGQTVGVAAPRGHAAATAAAPAVTQAQRTVKKRTAAALPRGSGTRPGPAPASPGRPRRRARRGTYRARARRGRCRAAAARAGRRIATEGRCPLAGRSGRKARVGPRPPASCHGAGHGCTRPARGSRSRRVRGRWGAAPHTRPRTRRAGRSRTLPRSRRARCRAPAPSASARRSRRRRTRR
mmetsp:Transcript_31554/g.80567  ORF Transcript_31554/g.80567 Transcript_31554/m.80567 type:complete len:205 (-) Transcript_31554:20-634(-)